MRGNRTRAPEWPFLDPAIWDEPKRGKAEWNQEPLSAYAREILAEHLRRKAFWLAIEGGVPTEFAGATYLPHLKTRRVHEIANEFDELARRGLSAAEAAREWLIERAVEGFNSRRIGPGRATCRDTIATLFFTSIAGGQDGFEDLKVRVSWAVDPCQKDSIYRQVLDYTMFSRPRGRPRKDG